MTWFKKITQILNKISKNFLSLDKYEYDNVVIKKEVIETIIELAQTTHPKEFVSFLEGKVMNKTLHIYGVLFQEYVANTYSAYPKVNFPLTSKIAGTIHSHPGFSNKPSYADLKFFSKNGFFHMIIKKPYQEKDIQGYNKNGERIEFNIIN